MYSDFHQTFSSGRWVAGRAPLCLKFWFILSFFVSRWNFKIFNWATTRLLCLFSHIVQSSRYNNCASGWWKYWKIWYVKPHHNLCSADENDQYMMTRMTCTMNLISWGKPMFCRCQMFVLISNETRNKMNCHLSFVVVFGAIWYVIIFLFGFSRQWHWKRIPEENSVALNLCKTYSKSVLLWKTCYTSLYAMFPNNILTALFLFLCPFLGKHRTFKDWHLIINFLIYGPFLCMSLQERYRLFRVPIHYKKWSAIFNRRSLKDWPISKIYLTWSWITTKTMKITQNNQSSTHRCRGRSGGRSIPWVIRSSWPRNIWKDTRPKS